MQVLLYSFISVFFLCLIFLIFQKKFTQLSFEVQEKNSISFLNLAKEVFEKYQEKGKRELEVKQKEFEGVARSFTESLTKIEEYTREVERQRCSAYSSLNKQLDSLISSEHVLRKETANLVQALRSPNIRGAWGQLHLRRVVELAGLLNKCDFLEEESKKREDDIYRPDLVVYLPGKRNIIVDAKTPLDAYLQAVHEENEEEKMKRLKDHAVLLRRRVKELGTKKYWKCFENTPDYVILFLPAEAFFSSALLVDPALLENAASLGIIIATPTTLIAILRAISFAWKQDSISKNAKEIAEVGKELYERLSLMNNHWQSLGRSLSASVDSYNRALSSLESRVLVSAKKLKELGTSSEELKPLREINKTTRSLKDVLDQSFTDNTK